MASKMHLADGLRNGVQALGEVLLRHSYPRLKEHLHGQAEGIQRREAGVVSNVLEASDDMQDTPALDTLDNLHDQGIEGML